MAPDKQKELERKRRYREKIKQEGGERLARRRQQALRSYHKTKENRTPREKRVHERRRKNYMKEYREKKKTSPVINTEDTTTVSDSCMKEASFSTKSIAAVKREKRKRLFRLKLLERCNVQLKKTVKRLRKREERSKSKSKTSSCDNQNERYTRKEKEIMNSPRKTKMASNVHLAFIKSIKRKYHIRRQITPILKQISKRNRGVKTHLRDLIETDFRVLTNSTTEIHRKKIDRSLVQSFYCRDDNSRPSAGKKETITIQGKTYQKRFLLSSVDDIFQKFKTENPMFPVSRATFFFLRPKFVMRPKLSDREMCLCIKCENPKLLLKSLHENQILESPQLSENLKKIVCSPDSKVCCFDQCSLCHSKLIATTEEITASSDSISYFQWKRLKGATTVTKRIKCETSFENAILECDKSMSNFGRHQFAFKNQFQEMTWAKQSLQNDELCLLIDFSENYTLKFGNEVQSAHFGSNDQVVIHQGVAYFKERESKCFATLSTDKRKTSDAVIAHIQKAIQLIDMNPKKLIIFSDSPSSQYRNRNTIQMLAKLCEELNIPSYLWYFSESGHGKSAADGVGAVIKRRWDAHIARGDFTDDICDLYNLTIELNILTAIVLKSEIDFVSEWKENIFEMKGKF